MKKLISKVSTLNRKNFDQESGYVSGYASVFNVVDQHNDIIKNGAFKKVNCKRIKFLWQHKSDEPIGVIEELYEDEYGLYFRAKLLLDLPQAAGAYSLLKSEAISGVSIGFKPVDYHYEEDTRVIKSLDLWEISLVTFPANVNANIIEIKNNNKLGANMKNTNQQQAWEKFQSVNEEILQAELNSGSVDPLLTDQLGRINDYLDEYKSRIDAIETSMSRPFKASDGLYNLQDNEYKRAFDNYLRSGNEQYLSAIEKKSLSSVSDSDGGYLVTSKISKDMVMALEEISPMRRLASCEQISSSSLDVIESYNSADAGWASEADIREETAALKIHKRNIPVFELYAQPSATQKLLDDSFIDVENWLAEKLIESFSKLENKSFINGDGVKCPRGILSYGEGKEWGKIECQKTNKLDYDSILSIYYELKDEYISNASFLMNRATIHQLRSIKDSNGRYVWSPSIETGMVDTLFGVPVHQAVDMPIPEKGKVCIAVADFKSAYKIVDRAGVRVLRDPYTFKPFVKFYTTKRVGGDVVNFEAIKLLKLA